MTDHLPECGYSPGQPGWGSINGGVPQKYVQPSPCICDQLRACEQRLLDAAREAVAALQMGVLTTGTLLLKREDALGAIDALKEKS